MVKAANSLYSFCATAPLKYAHTLCTPLEMNGTHYITYFSTQGLMCEAEVKPAVSYILRGLEVVDLLLWRHRVPDTVPLFVAPDVI